MIPSPLHPAMVHVPLGLAVLMPILAAGFAWALWSGRVRPRAWLAVIALQLVLLGSGLLAMNTGGAEEDRVEAVVQKSAIHVHEEYAEQFVWAVAGSLGLCAVVLALRPRPRAAQAVLAAYLVSTVAVAGLALRVGHAGGQLVYVHGAASAYTSAGQSAGQKTETSPAQGKRQTRVERDDRR